MAGFDNDVMYAENVDFSGGTPVTGKVTTNAQLLIGSSVAPNIKVGQLTSPLGTIQIGYSSPNITLDLTGGSSAIEKITGDSGFAVPVGGNINLFGNPDIQNTGVADTLQLTNLTKETPYVVGPTGQARFTSIQAAINQAVTDGAAWFTNPKVIQIQAGNYTESFTLPDGIFICGSPVLKGFSTIINGTITNTSTIGCSISNIELFSAGDAIIDIITTTGSLNISNCAIFGNINLDFTTLVEIRDSSISSIIGLSTGSINIFNSDVSGDYTIAASLTALNCNFVSNDFNPNSNSFSSIVGGNFYAGNSFTLVAANLNMSYVNIQAGSVAITVDGTSILTLLNCFNVPAISGAGSVISNEIFSTAGPAITTTTQAGYAPYYLESAQLVKVNLPAGDYSVSPLQDYFIGADTTGARAITLDAAPLKGQYVIVKDKTGTAATFNITVSGNGKNIDGTATKVISVNYGSLSLVYTGTEWLTTENTSIFGETITGDSGGALLPSSGNWNILGRSGSKTSGSGSTLTVKSPPFSQVGASATSSLNTGEFVTAAVTRTLPASAGLADGDLFIYVCTTAGALVIQSVTAQKIRIGSLITGAAGSATSTAIGDSLTLRFNATDGFFYAVSVVGTWVLSV